MKKYIVISWMCMFTLPSLRAMHGQQQSEPSGPADECGRVLQPPQDAHVTPANKERLGLLYLAIAVNDKQKVEELRKQCVLSIFDNFLIYKFDHAEDWHRQLEINIEQSLVGIKSILHLAVDKDDTNALEILWDQEWVQKYRDFGNYPLLLCAACRGRKNAMKKLVELGVNTKQRNQMGHTLLHLVLWMNDQEIIEWVVSIIPEFLDEPDSRGRTPLLHAALQGWPQAVITLLRLGANPLSVDDVGNTLMHCAALSCDMRVVEIIWNYFPQMREQLNDWGQTPLEVCLRCLFGRSSILHFDVLKFLLLHVANAHCISKIFGLNNWLADLIEKPHSIRDFDVIRLLIMRGAVIGRGSRRVAIFSESIYSAWRQWCEAKKIPYKPFIEALEEWVKEYEASVVINGASQDQINAGQLQRIIHGGQNTAALLPDGGAFPAPVLEIVQDYLGGGATRTTRMQWIVNWIKWATQAVMAGR